MSTPAAHHRSPVPDLLYEETQAARLAELGPLLRRPEALGEGTPLHRLTVFVTDRCNLACTYCKARRAGARHLHDAASLARVLDRLGGAPLRHVHFTGGEPTLAPALPAMVRLARRRGAERASVTTNGTAAPRRTLALLDAGLDELRLSLDAHEPGLGLALSGRAGAWRAAVATLRAVARARRGGAVVHVVVNAVATPANRRHLARLVRFALDEGADDVKLITEVEGREGLPAFPELPAVRAELAALLAARPPGALPLLRRKVRTVFAPEAIGLDGERPPPGRPWRCLIPLTERTVDGAGYYPCPVYRREGGRPLGPLADAPAAQRAASARFVREADCLSDPICRRYCLHCTRAFNARANAAAEAA